MIMQRFTLLISIFLLSTALYAANTSLQTLIQNAKKGNKTAQYDLAMEYMFGKQISQEGIEQPPRYAEAVKWLTKAATAGDPKSQYMLGTLYERGRGVNKSAAEAMKWYKKAVDNNFKEAACPLARLYEKSDIRPKDPDVTLPCYMK